MNNHKNRFYERFDLVFWSIIKILPFIFLAISSINNLVDIAYIETFLQSFNVPFFSNILFDIVNVMNITIPNIVVYMLSYFFIIELAHLLLDCMAFIIRLGYKLLGGAFQ